jgi:hypothetical protein
MPAHRRIQATFTGAVAIPADGDAGPEHGRVSDEVGGVRLGFRPVARRLDIERIEDFADLRPQETVTAVEGLGKVLRLLRAARIALPDDPLDLVGQEEFVAGLLERAVGTRVVLELRARSRIRFVAWTDGGIETVDHVTEVLESDDAYLVLRKKGRFPVRLPRDRVVRQRTETERWYEVMHIERAPANHG